MRAIRTTVWLAAVLAIALSGCAKKEAAAKPKAAAPMTQQQSMAAPAPAAPSGQTGASQAKSSDDSGY